MSPGQDSGDAVAGSGVLTSHFSLLASPAPRLFVGLFALLLALPATAAAQERAWRLDPVHPRLLITRDDLPDLRVRCGIEDYRDDPVAHRRGVVFGAQREVLERLRDVGDRIITRDARRDDLYVPAVLHLATGRIGQADRYTHYVARQLLDPDRIQYDLDALVALDHCWDALGAEQRRRIVDRLLPTIRPFDRGDSPLNHLAFDMKLRSLAAALVIYDHEFARDRPDDADYLGEIITTAGEYLSGPFVRFFQQRGAMPTSGGRGIWEEQDGVLAIELWLTATGRNLWPDLSDSLARAMDHYFYADTEYPGLDHGFIHDDGSHIPLNPGRVYERFLPAVPWVIANRTRDPIATYIARRGLPTVMPEMLPETDRYQWVRLLYGPLDQPEAARAAYPLARHFGGGWVAMRSGWEPGATVLLFDAGQPFWRARQHFDAGQFQIYRKGRLAIDSGDDVTHEAVPSRGGRVMLQDSPGAWEHYFQATIAHNCITVADRRHPLMLYGRPWLAIGNQRPIEGSFDLLTGDIARTNRVTGRLTAFETNSFYSYAAADVSAAYSPDLVQSIQREILFLNAGAVLVLDRVEARRKTSIKTWHLQLPAAPRVDGMALDELHQLHGVDARAGVWEMRPDEAWLDVSHMDGRLFVQTLAPEPAERRIGGGPMKAATIPTGDHAGRTYHGGDPSGYEHRLWPASMLRSPNMVYELGDPIGLGPQFGVGATWGRLDVSPSEESDRVVFLHLLIPTDRTVEEPPPTEFGIEDFQATLQIALPDQKAHITLNLAEEPGGTVRLIDPRTDRVLFEKTLTAEIRDTFDPSGGLDPEP